MIKEKFYSFDEIDLVNYKLDLCKEKNEFLKCLRESKPQKIEQIDTRGTHWVIGYNFGIDNYYFYINGGIIHISTITESISGLLEFLTLIAYHDNTDLILNIFDEGSYSAITAIMLDDENIRFTVFDYGLMENKKILSDIIINKNTLLKQFLDVLVILNSDMHQVQRREYVINLLNNFIPNLKSYFDNPVEFKNNYNYREHIRVFDIAYKNLDGKWKFKIHFKNEEESQIEYWQKQLAEGKILNFDFVEQSPQSLYCWQNDEPRKKQLTVEELRKSISPDMFERTEERNWVYSTYTKKWYSTNETMDMPLKTLFKMVHTIEPNVYSNYSEDYTEERIVDIIKDKFEYGTDFKLKFSCYNDEKQELKFCTDCENKIKNALKKLEQGEDVRVDVDWGKMFIWNEKKENDTESKQIYVLSKSNRNYYIDEKVDVDDDEIYCAIKVNKQDFINSFLKAFDDIHKTFDTMKRVVSVGEKLEISRKFKYASGSSVFKHIDNFIGDYACVQTDSDGYGIINQNFEWVIAPESVAVWGKTHKRFGKELKGYIKKYKYLHNIDGKLFIAAKEDNKQFVIDINGDIQIPHVSDRIHYTYINNELYFVAVDYNKTYFVNSKGEDILTLEFPIDEKFWLLSEILILSKDNKFGILDWKGNMLIDFIFSDIKVDPKNLNFIPVKYLATWGFINAKGEVLNFKRKV